MRFNIDLWESRANQTSVVGCADRHRYFLFKMTNVCSWKKPRINSYQIDGTEAALM